jgi:hypothetical protein
MDIQFLLMIAIFIGAVFYVGRMIYQSVAPKKDGCATGCGKCAANFDQSPPAKS